jgi:hypothetical protein
VTSGELAARIVEQGMSRTVKRLACIAGIGVCLVFVFVAWELTPGLCGNDVESEAISPDGKWKAVVFVVDCGAATTSKELAPRVAILPAKKALEGHDSDVVFGAGNPGNMSGVTLQVDWSGNNELTIRYPRRSEVFKQDSLHKGVTINYQTD